MSKPVLGSGMYARRSRCRRWWLLTLGIPIQYVSRQLGHGSIAVTETHYAEYLGGGGADHVYVEPPRLAGGEVPADLLARVRDCSHAAHTGDPFALPEFLQRPETALVSVPEAFPVLVPGSDFKGAEIAVGALQSALDAPIGSKRGRSEPGCSQIARRRMDQ